MRQSSPRDFEQRLWQQKPCWWLVLGAWGVKVKLGVKLDLSPELLSALPNELQIISTIASGKRVMGGRSVWLCFAHASDP